MVLIPTLSAPVCGRIVSHHPDTSLDAIVFKSGKDVRDLNSRKILKFSLFFSRTTKVPSGKEQNPEEIQLQTVKVPAALESSRMSAFIFLNMISC